MAYSTYQQRRGNYYDMRGMPYLQQPHFNGGYFAYHPMDVEYQQQQQQQQRSRPTKLTPRVLNKRFKKVTIQMNENKVLLVSVGSGKGGKPLLVFSQCEGSYENKTNSVSIPESLVVPFIQQLHKLSKWRPSTSGNLPIGQGLNYEDTVFRTQVVCLSEPEEAPELRQYAIKILAEARARDPQDRKELAAISIPLDTGHLMKVKEALSDVIVPVAESPLYHTKSIQGADGSKFYLDMIRDDEAHYLKVSQVTRDFRSILHVPAEDLEAFKDLLDSSVKAMKAQLEDQKVGGGGGGSGGKKRRSRQGRRRPRGRSDANKGSPSTSDCDDAKENNGEAKQPGKGKEGGKEEAGQPPKKVLEVGEQPKVLADVDKVAAVPDESCPTTQAEAPEGDNPGELQQQQEQEQQQQ